MKKRSHYKNNLQKMKKLIEEQALKYITGGEMVKSELKFFDKLELKQAIKKAKKKLTKKEILKVIEEII